MMKEKVLNNKKNGMLVLILTTLLYLLSIAVCVVGAMIGRALCGKECKIGRASCRERV